MIRVRVDDFPQTKGEPQHTLAAYREFHRCLSECIGGKRYLLGVIPLRCSVDDLLFLQRETDCIVGMHGTDHDEARLDRNGGHQFEPYMTVNSIRVALSDSRLALSGAVDRDVYVYMPPRNRLNEQTVQAARSAGFEAFTSGPETDQFLRQRWRSWDIHSAPPYEYGRTDELLKWGADQYLRDRCGDGFEVTLTLHWTWETNIGLSHMKEFFSRIPKDLFKDFDD